MLEVIRHHQGVHESRQEKPAHKVCRLWKYQASEVDAWARRGEAADGEPSSEKR